jgi:hypothetical protein
MAKLVHYEDVIGQLRIFPPGAEYGAPYIGSGMVVWRDPKNCEIRGLKADMTRQHWRDLCAVLRERGAERIYAKRGPGKLLPFAHPADDGWQFIELADVQAHTGPAPLN